ncbi:helicase C-terminal domain-containing protein [Streptomyces sp. RB6PN25]|uniref:Helicase C-terminal domain-containing protein n=1 Tax=Streptomyces humicola TaxID=2953240 RepID=A0ABT1Q8E5_9ACTN|nr:helicase C-terminal domain-containing protein [Streptomyces humicola]MCQ4085100.1 helicase C-terminal domain-containing protein [Streptomyces humicola]
MSDAPRTLAEDLRGRGDDAVATLLRLRPDLLNPVPNDLTQLATRAGTRASVVRALERLDRFALQTAEALAVAPDPCPYETLLALLGGDEGIPEVTEALPGAVDALRASALVWGGDDRLHLVRTARDLLAPTPTSPSATGLGPTVTEATAGMSPGRLQELLAAAGLPATHDPVSAVAALTALFRDRTRMSALLAEAPEGTATVLSKLMWGPPYGEVRAEGASAPVRWLLARGVLLPAGPGNVVLPREAALHLRGGLAHRTPEPHPPAVQPGATHAIATVDATAAGQAFTAVRTVEDLLKSWDAGGPPVLRAGGMSVRDLKRTAVALDVGEPIAAFWLETAYAAGLLASDGEADERYAPTPAYDEWLRLPDEERWAALVAAWLPATRTPGLVGGRDAKGRALSALGPELDRSLAPEVRRRVLALLASLPEGASAKPEALLARLRWERPLRGGADALRAQLVHWTLEEAELLGVTGRGALSAHGRALQGRTEAATDAQTAAAEAAGLLAPLLPEPLDHVLLQADLTAVAPGPLRAPLAETLGVLADVESKGGATVYRFTPDSVRRALDAGRTADELHAFLAAHSRTPVPQPLTYLVDDVARRHGRLRVGAASAYVRCDDDSLLAEILADRRAAGLGLRRLAPTVLAAQSPPDVLLERLRSMGFAPAAESAAGDVLITRPDAYRTPPRSASLPVPEGPPVPDETLLGAAVKAIRAGDRAATAVRKPVPRPAGARLPRTTSADTLAAVQAAVLAGEALWIGYVNADGAASQRVVEPVRVEGGFVTAFDHTADEVRTFALHRITGVAELAEPAGAGDEPA